MKIEEIYDYYTSIQVYDKLSENKFEINFDKDSFGNFITANNQEKNYYLEINFSKNNLIANIIISKNARISQQKLMGVPNLISKIDCYGNLNNVLTVFGKKVYTKVILDLKKTFPLKAEFVFDTLNCTPDYPTKEYLLQAILEFKINTKDISNIDLQYLDTELLEYLQKTDSLILEELGRE